LSSSLHFSPSAGEGPQIRRPSTAVLIVLTGARAGTRCALTSDFATLGRHASSDLQFDPEQDNDVSARHAAVFRQGPGYVIRDLGSTTGTWVNGLRIRSDRSLEHGDRIRLGPGGPEIEFTVEQAQERPPARFIPADEPAESIPASPTHRRSTIIEQEQSTSALKLRVEAARQTDRLRRRLFGAAVAIVLAVAAGLSWMAWSARQSSLALEHERARVLARVDSVRTVLQAAATEAPDLKAALDGAAGAMVTLRAAIAERATSREVIPSLESEVQQEGARHEPLLRAARFDAAPLMKASGRSLARVFVSRGESRASASGFVLRVSGDTGWIVTTRSVLEDSTDLPPERIAVAFNGGTTAWRTQVVEVHSSLDLALIRAIAPGHVFPAAEVVLTSGVAVGDPVALVGYPAPSPGTQAANWQRDGLKATTVRGTILSVAETRLEVDGYGASGSNGSPVFNAAGQVIGLVFGARPESRTLPAIPASALKPWMPAR
jgi:S1-C subfamily serine protease